MQIEGSVNFRDMSDGTTWEGRRLRPGRVFRSGTMHAITDGGLDVIASLGVSVAFDLRSNSERSARPSRLPPATVYHVHDHERQTGNFFQTLKSLSGQGDGVALMRKVYRELPYEFSEPYRKLFRLLAEGAGPVVFNCAAGKDRTGVAGALLLAALGAPTAHIYADYMKTEAASDIIVEMFMSSARRRFAAAVQPSLWRPVLRVDPQYLDAMFEGIIERDGSIDGYLERELQLDTARLDALRAGLLE